MIDPVWELYHLAHRLTGGASTLLEWDAKIPAFPVVHAEALKARTYMAEQLPRTEEVRGLTPLRANGASVSNPISFLVPDVQDESGAT